MQTIEQIPPEVEKTAAFTDQELTALALAQAQPVVEHAAYSFARMLFWTVMIGGAIGLGAFILLAPTFRSFEIGC